MPAVTLDGAVVERTGDLRYLGIHFHIMLTYRKHVDTAALQFKKGLLVLKAIAAKGIEQRDLFRHPPWKPLWVYCPGPAGVEGNGRADRLVGKATITRGLLFGRFEVLRSLIHYLRAQSQIYHTIDRLHERGWTIFFQRTREGHRQAGEHWNRFKGNVGVTLERWGGTHGLFRVHRYQLELNYASTVLCFHSTQLPQLPRYRFPLLYVHNYSLTPCFYSSSSHNIVHSHSHNHAPTALCSHNIVHSHSTVFPHLYVPI